MADQLELLGTEEKWIAKERLLPRSGRRITLRNVMVQDENALADMVILLSAKRDISHDTETSGLNPHLGARIIGHCLAAQTDDQEITAWYVPIRHMLTAQPQLPVPLVSEGLDKILQAPGRLGQQHAKFDWLQGRSDNIRPPSREVHDVSTLALLDNENEQSFGLKRLADKYCMAGARKEEKQLDDWMRTDARKLGLRFKKRLAHSAEDVDSLGVPTYLERFGYARTPIHLCARYGCRDAFYTLYLWLVKYAHVPAQYPVCYAREQKVSRLLHQMEWVGLPVNEALIRSSHDKTGREVLHWLNTCRRLTNNPEFEATDAELRIVFHNAMSDEQPGLGLPIEKWTKGGKSGERKASVDKEARELLKRKHPQHLEFIEAVGSLAEARKFHSTYSGNFLRYFDPDTARIFPSYNQLEQRDDRGVPVTGRLSSANPNSQNIASSPLVLLDGYEINIRRYFVVPDGMIRFYIDFSQIELRVLAWLSQDPNLIMAYQQGLDIHQMTSDLLDIVRRVAKQVNFLTTYGGTNRALALRMPGYYDDPEGTLDEAQRILDGFFMRYPGIKTFERKLAKQMRRQGNMFVSHMGRPRRLPDISSPEGWKKARAIRQMMSSIVSGIAADLMKEAMIATDVVIQESRAEASVMGEALRQNPDAGLVQSIHDELVFDMPYVQGWDFILLKLMAVMEDQPMFTTGPQGRGEGVPITVGADVTTSDWGEKHAITRTPTGIQIAS